MKKTKLSEDYVHSDSSEGEQEQESNAEASNAAKSPTKQPAKQSSNSPHTFQLSNKRRITLRQFKSSLLVDIREFYEDRVSGEELPGKKGISLTLEQFHKLKELIPAIEAAIEEF